MFRYRLNKLLYYFTHNVMSPIKIEGCSFEKWFLKQLLIWNTPIRATLSYTLQDISVCRYLTIFCFSLYHVDWKLVLKFCTDFPTQFQFYVLRSGKYICTLLYPRNIFLYLLICYIILYFQDISLKTNTNF